MTKGFPVLVLAAVLGSSAGPARARAISYQFMVQAEARGFVSQSFGDLGTATMLFTPQKDAGFRVQGSGNVVHPLDSSVVYRYELDMHFLLKGDELKLKSRENTSNKAGKEILDIVEEILPFVYLSKMLPRTAKGYTLATPFGKHTMSYSGTATEWQVSLKSGTREVARFYVRPASRGLGKMLRFRINRRTGANLMFVPR